MTTKLVVASGQRGRSCEGMGANAKGTSRELFCSEEEFYILIEMMAYEFIHEIKLHRTAQIHRCPQINECKIKRKR